MAWGLQNDANAPVQLVLHRTETGLCLAEARLNAEATLNALSLEMIDMLSGALKSWAEDPQIAAVLITAVGDRAFSAGGDIQALYRAMQANHRAGTRVDDYPYQFFEREYRLDYLLHTYAKPVIALGHGIIMGGGLGVFSASRYRLVTEKSRIAMPEITIGLFPDAGATWLLRNMPQHCALFLGMTGSHMNAADALQIGLGTHGLTQSARAELLPRLLAAPWDGAAQTDGAMVDALLGKLPAVELPPANLDQLPFDLSVAAPLVDVVAQLRALSGASDWIDRGLSVLTTGCPTSVGIVLEQLKRAPALSLADTFRLEMTVATHCADNADFAEGVRALIIDKTNDPGWQFGSLAALPPAYVASHFEEPWPQNPLFDLEKTA